MTTPETTIAGLQATSVILHDSFDESSYRDALHIHPRLNEVVAQNSAQLPSAPPLIEDVYYSLFQPAPHLVPESDISLTATVNRAILEQMMVTNQWGELREAGTIGDSLYSGMATASVTKAVLASLHRQTITRLKELQEAEQEANNLLDEAEALTDIAQAASGDRAEDLRKQAEEAREKARLEQERAAQLHEELSEELETIEDTTRQASREAFEEAQGEVESLMAALKTFTGGYDEETPGAPKSIVTLKERVKLAATVEKSAKLKQIAELCGRLTRIALECQKVRVLHPPDEVVGITIGADLAKLLPQELVLLTDPDFEILFYQRYLEKSLMQIDMRGSEKQGRGDIIVASDSSGSMAAALGGRFTKEAWAKAVALALLAIARKQKRNLVMLHFAETNQLKSFVFPKGGASPRQLLEATEFFFNGRDTQYHPWMEESLRLVDCSEFNKADVILLSDGLASVSAQMETEWNQRRKTREMRCYSVLLEVRGSGESVLGRISDGLVTIDNLTQDNQALQMMFSI